MIAYGFAIMILCVSNMVMGARITRLERELKAIVKVKWDRS